MDFFGMRLFITSKWSFHARLGSEQRGRSVRTPLLFIYLFICFQLKLSPRSRNDSELRLHRFLFFISEERLFPGRDYLIAHISGLVITHPGGLISLSEHNKGATRRRPGVRAAPFNLL